MKRYALRRRIAAMLISLMVMLCLTLGDALCVFADAEEAAPSADILTDVNDEDDSGETLDEAEVAEIAEDIIGTEGDTSETAVMADDSDAETEEAEAEPEEEPDYSNTTPEEVMLMEATVNGAAVGDEDPDNETEAVLVNSVKRKWVTKSGDAINLRSIAKCTSGKFGILQGSCSDGGKYAYFAFNRKSDDAVKVVKMKVTFNKTNPALTTFKFVKSTPVLKHICHGNDMAYVKNAGGSGMDRIIIITSSTGGKNGCYLGILDPATMTEIGGKVYKYWADMSECDPAAYPSDTNVKKSKRRSLEGLVGDHHGYSTIAYDEESGLFAATVKSDRDILVLKPKWKNGNLTKLSLLKYRRQNKINATSQGIDCDENFIYTCWSPMANVLGTNLIQVYDWDGEHVGDIDMGNAYEFESLFRIKNGSKSSYYASFYHSYVKAYKVKKKYKVKWKKVKKKVNGKWKKVWKYKTKYRKVTKYKIVRNAYCMSIGALSKQVKILRD